LVCFSLCSFLFAKLLAFRNTANSEVILLNEVFAFYIFVGIFVAVVLSITMAELTLK